MLSCFRNPVVAHEIGKKIQALNQQLLDLQERSSRFGFIIQAINSSAPSTNQAANPWSNGNQHTGPTLVDSDIVGEKVQESKRKLIDVLIKKVDAPAAESRDSNVAVAVAIIGTGGIGETTLARMVFNDPIVAESFDNNMIWLWVGKEVSQTGVLKRVIAAFGGSYDGLADDKGLLEQALKQIVEKKKFFLVMDDMWSDTVSVWTDLLRAPLNGSAL